MEYNTITDLLEKYWSGSSSLDEEKQLKQYFAQEKVAPELQDYQTFFRGLNESAEAQMTEDFDDRFFAAIDQLDQPSGATGARVIRFPRLARYAAAVAVVVATLVGVRQYVLPTSEAPVLAAHEVEDPEEALAHTMEALRLLGVNIKKGEVQTDKVFATFQSAKEAVR